MSERPVLAEPLVRARGLTRFYQLGAERVIGVNNVNLHIGSGELVVLKGNSGSGKSSLLAMLAGLDQPSQGELIVAGHDLTRASSKQLTYYRREVIGMVFQSFNLLPTLTVLENVKLPALLAGKPDGSTQIKALQLLEELGLDGRLNHFPAQLSGGEMQRTAIARALINDPSMILADEPTGNLDTRNGELVIKLLADLNRLRGTTIVIATHSNLADRYASVQLSLKDGNIIDQACKNS